MKKILTLIVLICLFSGCTSNSRAKNWGGTDTVKLPKGQKFINVTWKDNNLWYVSRPMKSDEQAESYTFQEISPWGIVEGTVKIIETK